MSDDLERWYKSMNLTGRTHEPLDLTRDDTFKDWLRDWIWRLVGLGLVGFLLGSILLSCIAQKGL